MHRDDSDVHSVPGRILVFGRRCSEDRVHMQPRLRLSVYNDDRVCGNHGHLRCLWCRLQLCGKWRAGCGVFVFAWLCVDLDDF